ncbi:MAG: hypothetical protein KDA41_14675, partial [Planctomycetales bacterium]|nr:hypothetical protein [Planctomycetales bacterium]
TDPARLQAPPAPRAPSQFSNRPDVQLPDERGLPSLALRPLQNSPFADQVVATPDAARRNELLPGRSDTLAAPSRFSAGGAPPNSAAGRSAKSDELLAGARKALAAGDVKQAGQLVDEAGRLGLTYPPNVDTPTKVGALIEQQHRMFNSTALTDPRSQSPEFKRAYVQHLLAQADGLLGYRELDAAEDLARRATALKPELGPQDRSPAQVLAQIASLRRGPGVEAGAPQAPGGRSRKDEAVALLAQARAAMARGDFAQAERFALTAKSLQVPDAEFGPRDEQPWMVLIDLERVRGRQEGPQPANFEASPEQRSRFAVQQGNYDPQRDPSQVIGAQATGPALPPGPLGVQPPAQLVSEGVRFYEEGLRALEDHDKKRALESFRKSWKFEQELDPTTRSRLRTYLQELAVEQSRPAPDTRLGEVEAQQQVQIERVFTDVSRGLREAENLRERDPKGAIEQLKQLQQNVAESQIPGQLRDQQSARIDRAIRSLEQYVEDNRALIENDERNRQVREEIAADQTRRIEVQETLAKLVDDFNRTMDEHNFAEAEAIARQARELDAESPYVQTMLWKVRFVRRYQTGLAIREQSEEGVTRVLMNADLAAVPFDDNDPLQFPDVRYWEDLTRNRRKHAGDGKRRMSEADMQIYSALKKKVDVRFTDRPLSEVIYTLAASAGINVHLDRQGLSAEGITSDTPVTINLTQPISLGSALNHILHELRLSYVVQDEVLKVTSEQMRESDVYRAVYNVADLVIPIPNFTPSYNMGLAAALQEAHASLGVGLTGGRVNEVPLQVAGGAQGSHTNPLALGQMNPGMGRGRNSQPIGFGPGGVSGGSQPDFDSLIDLLTATVEPTSWDEVGGPGSIVGFETNLSLVISQTQEVHDEIVDLLEQLRRLQDLQVTIEVRFITLSDNFFERIGVDFDFDIQDHTYANNNPANLINEGPSVTIGLDPTGAPTADLDLAFNQGSFASAVPTFGGFDPATAANFGFAILGEIEAFFVIQAAQGDTRTNVMQAPKVTLFNGQQAYVSDTSQTPFVTSVIPVVGDFAAAHQPVIIVLTEGTSLSVQAVVSPDRRFVRLTIVPFFSKIGAVKEFTFTGKKSSSSSQTAVDPDANGDNGSSSQNAADIVEGTTVQLPTFSFVTVTTTVSVPDGGTVLLGGVKRLSEGRTERGVPVLNKVPYVNRLFKNVGIGRETQSLMMMVTPRIIIQEEEEEKLGIGGFGTGSP